MHRQAPLKGYSGERGNRVNVHSILVDRENRSVHLGHFPAHSMLAVLAPVIGAVNVTSTFS